MHLIRHLPEPIRLLLAWQSSRPGSSRRRWEVGELTRDSAREDASVTFQYFDEEKLAGAIAEGFDSYPAFRLRQAPSENVLETFMRRLPSRRRTDFPRYLETLRIDPSSQFSDFALLAASEARLPSDGFSIVNPLDDLEGPLELLIEAAGYRHLPDRPIPSQGAAAKLALDSDNPKDPNAIAIQVDGKRVGWVNRLQTTAFKTWMSEDRISVNVDRVNGTAEHPRLYLFVTIADRGGTKGS